MILWKKIGLGLVVGGIAALATAAQAQDPNAKPAAAEPVAAATDRPPTMAEFNRLQAEVREQRQLLIEMMQSEQQRYDMLLKLMKTQSGAILPEIALPTVPQPGALAAANAANAKSAAAAAVEAAHRNAPLTGRVSVAGGGDLSDVYVFIENVKGGSGRGKTIEIRQQNKQFVPRLAVVQAGTNIVFPNFDSVYHNVFSPSPQNTFDLGSYRAGDKARSITLTKPGVVEIFCNMHQKMSANVLVVPSPLYTRVRSDGTFRIENVPVGLRKVVAWSPKTKANQQRVDIGASGGQVTFSLDRDDGAAHLNKLGQAYGSYRE